MSGGAFRHDIQGLRAVAVLLVLAYHLWPEAVSGGFIGVDVFFVISGFLITAHLLQHPPRRPRDLLEFWGRRIRRILPAAFLVLAVTAIASRLIAPETRWAANAGEIIASALYVENWTLAANSVDYLAAEASPTPVQHYWSLSVEEQFYLLWPILLLAVYWLVRRLRLDWPPVARVAMLTVVGSSLMVSIVATDAEPASAYFISQTRVWELAAGGVLSTLPPLRRPGLAGRTLDGVAWLGLGMVLVAGFAFSDATPFPGGAALLPVLGTALVIAAATDGPTSPTRLLRVRPVQHVGDASYSIYLWHWPLITLWPYAVGPVTPIDSVVILGVTIGLSSITKVHVEDAFRFAPSLQPLGPTFRFAAVGMLVLSIGGTTQLVEVQVRQDAAVASAPDWLSEPDGEPGDELAWWKPEPSATGASETAAPPSIEPPPTASTPQPSPSPESCVGAAAIVFGFASCPQDPAGPLIPEPLVARHDVSRAYRDGCWTYSPFTARITCRYGNGDVRVALVGNSHAGQWLPTLQVLAKRHGWTITTFLVSRCNVTDATLELYSAAAGCLEYGRWVMAQTGGEAFDLVITSERQSVPTRGDRFSTTMPVAVAGYTTYLKRWSASGTNVLILHDTPYPGRTLDTVPDCLARHPKDQSACSGTPETWRWLDPLYTAANELALPGISTMAVERFFCTATECPAVIGSVVVYFDGSHMTATYARSLAPFVEAEILAALDEGPSD